MNTRMERTEKSSPWEETDATYEPPLTESRVERVAQRAGELGLNGGSLYCHKRGCRKGDLEMPIEAEVILSMIDRAPHPVSENMRQKLSKLGMKKFKVNLHTVHDGFTAYVLIGPSIKENGREVSGWYCSPECVDDVCWPTADHIAVAADLHIDHPPDVHREVVPPRIRSIKGVYRQTPPEYQMRFSDEVGKQLF